MIDSFDKMFDAPVRQRAAQYKHPPLVIYVLMFGVAMMAALLAGYGMARHPTLPIMHSVIFAAAVAITIEAFPTSNLFKRGHRIRLDISSSNFPHFDVNPNTGAPEGRGMTRQIARNTIYLDRARASHVVLPIIRTRA